jgi:hypothetical protein
MLGNCPQQVNFFNVEFGDEFFAGFIPFVQGGFAGEGDLAGESGDFEAATYFCYSAWQLTVNDSNINVSALDRQANSEDEGEVDVTEVLTTLDDEGDGTTFFPSIFFREQPQPAASAAPSSSRSSGDEEESSGGIGSAGNSSGLRGPSGS